jgi:hypothetical protein
MSGRIGRTELDLELLAPSRASIAADKAKSRSLRCVQLPLQLQIDPERGPRLGIAQFDLGRRHARRREADDNVGPPIVGDGVSDQHVPQFASPWRRLPQLDRRRAGVNPSKVWVALSLFVRF